jgi:hypothetical protein
LFDHHRRQVDAARLDVRSKTDRAMRNEALCKILCHNICCLIAAMEEFGIPVDFGTPPIVPMAQPQLMKLG